jgi:hypothetical protein
MRDPVAPDLVIVGAARSGTSFLSATLDQHRLIDAGSVKEPNFYSSRWSSGRDWYDGLFLPRDRGLKRVDASVSYTYPQHQAALERIRDAAPDVQVVYAVREPIARLVSHYQLFRHYYGRTDWSTLSEAVATSEMFVGAGDYHLWLEHLRRTFPVEQVVVVPFPATTKGVEETAALLLSRLGLDVDEDLAAPAFRNETRTFRFEQLHALHRLVQKSRFYPALRARVGPDRLRALRNRITKPATLPSQEQELASLTPAQQEDVETRAAAANEAVSSWLVDQDQRLGMDWSRLWAGHIAPTTP